MALHVEASRLRRAHPRALRASRLLFRVYGTESDGRFESKIDLARHILESNGIDGRHAALVGDREQDMVAARKSSIVAIGVAYGYGSQEELASSGAHVVCATPKELETLILRKR